MNTLELAGTDRAALVSPEDYELVKGYRWQLFDDTWAGTYLDDGELIEMGRLLLRLKGNLCSPVPWNDQLN